MTTKNKIEKFLQYRIEHKLALGRRQEEASNGVIGESIPGAGNDAGDRLRLLEKEAHLVQKLILGNILGSFEDIGLGDLSKP